MNQRQESKQCEAFIHQKGQIVQLCLIDRRRLIRRVARHGDWNLEAIKADMRWLWSKLHDERVSGWSLVWQMGKSPVSHSGGNPRLFHRGGRSLVALVFTVASNTILSISQDESRQDLALTVKHSTISIGSMLWYRSRDLLAIRRESASMACILLGSVCTLIRRSLSPTKVALFSHTYRFHSASLRRFWRLARIKRFFTKTHSLYIPW